jgi:small conductance mechanosensitive channel
MLMGVNDLLIIGVQCLVFLLLILGFRSLGLRLAHRFTALILRDDGPARAVVSTFIKRASLVLIPLLIGAVLAFDLWVLSQGSSLLDFASDQLRRISAEQGTALAVVAGKGAALATLAVASNRVFRRVLSWLEHRALEQRRQDIPAPGVEIPIRTPEERAGELEAIALAFTRLRALVSRTVQLAVVVLLLELVGAPAALQVTTLTLARVYPFALLPFAVRPVFGLSAELLLHAMRGRLERRGAVRYFDALLPTAMLSRRLLELALLAAAAGLALLQLEATRWLAGMALVVIEILLTLLAARLLAELVEPLLRDHFSERSHLTELEKNRRRTLLPIFRGGLQAVTGLCAALLILIEVGIDPLPIVAGAGVVGMALGLGARELIGDLVAGFFMLVENHVAIGDYVVVNGVEGQVQAIHFRTLWIRQSSGALHILNNGEIRKLANYSRSEVLAYIQASVSYGTDMEALRGAVAQLEAWALEHLPEVVGPVRLRGVKEYGDSELEVEVTALCRPGQHDRMRFPLRTRLFEILRERGIDIPYPHCVLVPNEDLQRMVMPSAAPARVTETMLEAGASQPARASGWTPGGHLLVKPGTSEKEPVGGSSLWSRLFAWF